MVVLGIDASKAELALSSQDGKARLKNEMGPIDTWVRSLDRSTIVGAEATGRYHRPVLASLHNAGILSYLLNPLYVSRYARVLKPTVKNDRIDSLMIATYLD